MGSRPVPAMVTVMDGGHIMKMSAGSAMTKIEIPKAEAFNGIGCHFRFRGILNFEMWLSLG